MPRIVSVDDTTFTLPAVVKAADANLPARLQAAALSATYAPLGTLLIDGGNSTSIYTTTFNLDGGSAA